MEKQNTDSKGFTIVVIEDNPGDYILIEDHLIEKFQPITIKQFTDFESASHYLTLETCNCDLILLDLHLPDMHGIDLIKSILAISSKNPIIVLTGYSDQLLAKRSLELGISDFLIKDEINPALLHKSIEFAINRSRYVREIETQNEQLRNIAWTQSHVVRAPLSRILGIIDLIDDPNTKEDMSFWLEQLKISTLEMDDVVKKIVEQTQRLK